MYNAEKKLTISYRPATSGKLTFDRTTKHSADEKPLEDDVYNHGGERDDEGAGGHQRDI